MFSLQCIEADDLDEQCQTENPVKYHEAWQQLCSAKYRKILLLSLYSLVSYSGLIVPGGFGARGTEGKMKAVKFAREKKVPYLGKRVC